MEGEKKQTPYDINYYMPNSNAVVTIPAGTSVIEATNLPEGSIIAYWAEPWEGMGEEAASHQRTYGFGLRLEDVSPQVPVEGEKGAGVVVSTEEGADANEEQTGEGTEAV